MYRLVGASSTELCIHSWHGLLGARQEHQRDRKAAADSTPKLLKPLSQLSLMISYTAGWKTAELVVACGTAVVHPVSLIQLT